jgi:fatty-acyl-CoA synthase
MAAEAVAEPELEGDPPAPTLAAADGALAARIYAPEPEEPLSEPPPLLEPQVVEALAEPEPDFESRGETEPFPLDLLTPAPAPTIAPVSEDAFHAKPVFVADEAPLVMAEIPSGKKTREKAKGAAGGLLDGAIVIALAPALLVAVGALGVKFGMLDQATGHDLLTRDWAPKVAMLGLATGLLGLVVAWFGGFAKLWKKAALALAITLATLGAMVAANLVGGG